MDPNLSSQMMRWSDAFLVVSRSHVSVALFAEGSDIFVATLADTDAEGVVRSFSELPPSPSFLAHEVAGVSWVAARDESLVRRALLDDSARTVVQASGCWIGFGERAISRSRSGS